MNKFYVNQQDRETKEDLQLGDIISWRITGKKSKRFIIYETANGKIGLLDTRTWMAYKNEFIDLEEVINHFRNKEVDDNIISVIDFEDWCIYCP